MPSDDRTALITMLEKYQNVQGDIALEDEGQTIDAIPSFLG